MKLNNSLERRVHCFKKQSIFDTSNETTAQGNNETEYVTSAEVRKNKRKEKAMLDRKSVSHPCHIHL